MLNGNLSSIEQTANWPLLKLSQNIMLNNHLVPQNMINKPVVSPHFDCYMNNIIAPDHLITGLTKSLIDCCFDCLEAHPDKLKLESAVCIGLRSIGFHGDKNIYNYNSKSINSMSMSTIYCILLLLPSIITSCGFKDKIVCYDIIELLRELSALLFKWPSYLVDGITAVSFVHGPTFKSYLRKLHSLACSYVSSVH